jgi:hypothetical protein
VPWNQALAVLTLVADHRIVAAAHRIDAVFREESRRVARGALEGPKWFEARDRMETARLDFVNTARLLLARPGSKLHRLSGRLEPSEAVWEQEADKSIPAPRAPTQDQGSREPRREA